LELAPRELARLALAGDADLVAVDADAVLRRLDGARVDPVHRVVLQQVRERGVVGEVVDRHEVEICARLLRRAENAAADPAETVDSHTGCHGRLRDQVAMSRRASSARANVTMLTQRAPAATSVRVHSVAVAPVVSTSSTSKQWAPTISAAPSAGRNAPATLARRAAGCKTVWVDFADARSRASTTRRPVSLAYPRARRSA